MGKFVSSRSGWLVANLTGGPLAAADATSGLVAACGFLAQESVEKGAGSTTKSLIAKDFRRHVDLTPFSTPSDQSRIL
jgi:hypothetical protein